MGILGAYGHLLTTGVGQRFESAGVPAGPVLNVAAMHRDCPTLAREMVLSLSHRRIGKTATLGQAAKYSTTPAGIVRTAPVLGGQTREVLSEFGYSEKEIGELIVEQARAVG